MSWNLFKFDSIKSVIHSDDHVAVMLPQRLATYMVVVPLPQRYLHIVQ